jgi:hypothetical protein
MLRPLRQSSGAGAPVPRLASVRKEMFQRWKGTAVEKPLTIPAEDGATARLAAQRETDPVLLALPPRRIESQPGACEASGEPCLEQLQVIETGCGPKVETALLVELLARSPGLGPTLADPFEAHNYHNPLAGVNAYKHRLHALRCEFVNVRLRLHELETQLNQSCYHREVLEKHVQFLDATLEQMRASRAWKLVEKISRWRRIVSQWLGRG